MFQLMVGLSILENLDPLEVRILRTLHGAPSENKRHHGIWTWALPDKFILDPEDSKKEPVPENIEVSLWVLISEQVIDSAMALSSSVACVYVTPLGDSLVEACTTPPPGRSA